MTVSYGAGVPARVSPPNYWALSIIAFLFSFVFGGIAMYFSYQVGQRFSAHDDDGAMRASRNAKAWGIFGIVVGAIVFFAIIGSRS
jgi:Na+-driven multidrug efflux pump